MMPVNKAGLGLQNPIKSTNKKVLSLQHESAEIIRVAMGESELSAANHLQVVREERHD